MKWVWCIALAFTLFGLDIASKAYVYHHFPLNSGFSVFQNFLGVDFSITYAANKGAAWGVFSGFQDYLLYFRMIVVGGLLSYILFFNKEKRLLYPFMLIITGALGNVLDYFVYGHVVDMFYFKFGSYSYPIFNIADSVIFCGTVWLILGQKRNKHAPHKQSLS